MSFRLDLWLVSDNALEPLPARSLHLESRLEDWIARDPTITGMDVLVVGRQVVTEHGGRIDLLALDRDANTVLFELKRGRTPRDVVAQVLDYATWIKDLSYQDLDALCRDHTATGLPEAFRYRFGDPLPEAINEDHTLVIVAAELDDSSERIVQYLADDRGLRINMVCFNVFALGDQEVVGRAWLRDPVELEEQGAPSRRAPWSGYWFVNVGEGEHRTWADNMKYGFISAGHGEKYSRPLLKLAAGDRIFAYFKGAGYVGFGEVLRPAEPIRDFRIANTGALVLSLPLDAKRAAEDADDPRESDWCVAVRWMKTFPPEHAQTFKGVFANQNIVCKLRDPETVRYLERTFGVT